jgi:hypothetical protein
VRAHDYSASNKCGVVNLFAFTLERIHDSHLAGVYCDTGSPTAAGGGLPFLRTQVGIGLD